MSAITPAEEGAPLAATELTGTVEQVKNFEWNIARLFVRKEGESEVTSWALRILSVALVLPVVLTAILDLGRRAAFAVDLCNGKSWSLIDEVKGACKAAATKVRAVYDFYYAIEAGPITPHQRTQEITESIRLQVKSLINGYRGLNGGSFGSPDAVKAAIQIRRVQEELSGSIGALIEVNGNDPETFAGCLEESLNIVRQMIAEEAQDEPYIANKVERTGPPRLLSEKAFEEFVEFNRAHRAEQFAELAAEQGRGVVTHLSEGVRQGILTADQAKQVVKQQASVVYGRTMETGFYMANRASRQLINTAVKEKLITSQEGEEIDGSIRPTMECLAEAAARNIANRRPQLTEPLVHQKLVAASNQLIHQKRLSAEDRTSFLTAAQDLLQAHVEAEKQAQELVKGQVDLAEAEKAREAERAAQMASVVQSSHELYDLISAKHKQVDANLDRYAALRQRRSEMIQERVKIRTEKLVTIRGKEVTILEAANLYNQAVDRIAASKTLPPAEQAREIDALMGQGFDQETIRLINELQASCSPLRDVIRDMERLSGEIEHQLAEIRRLTHVYRVHRTNHKGELEEAVRKELRTLSYELTHSFNRLYGRYKKVFDKSLLSFLRSDPAPVVNPERSVNDREVEEILMQRQKPAEIVPSAPPLEELEEGSAETGGLLEQETPGAPSPVVDLMDEPEADSEITPGALPPSDNRQGTWLWDLLRTTG